MVEQNGPAGSNGTNISGINGAKLFNDAGRAWREAQGATPLSPFEFVPPLGFREYWYPALFKKEVGQKKPIFVKIMYVDIVFFRGKAEKVHALFDWCPHRSARLSQGESVFPGTITCEYHGYTFDGQGECVAGLIDDPNTPVVGKMKGKSYPTAEHGGIVYVWMGETEPVPLQEDLPPEILDDRNHWYNRVKVWDANWTEPVNQGIDYHEAYLHRREFNYMGGWTKPWRVKFHGLFSKNLPFFRPRKGWNCLLARTEDPVAISNCPNRWPFKNPHPERKKPPQQQLPPSPSSGGSPPARPSLFSSVTRRLKNPLPTKKGNSSPTFAS